MSSPLATGRARALLAVLVVAALGTALVLLVRGDDGAAGEAPTGPQASQATDQATLPVAWSTDLAPLGPEPLLRRTDDVIAFVGSASVVGLDRASGKELWTMPIARRCAASETTGDGLVVVVSGTSCSLVRAVDLATGAVRWSAKNRAGVADDPVVGVSELTATVLGECGRTERLRLADGARLDRASPRPLRCDSQADTDGRTIVVRGRPAAGGGRLTIRDADSGSVLFQRPGGYATELDVVSSDPLVLTTGLGADVATRQYDASTGRPGRVLVRGGHAVRFLDTVDGVALGLTQAEDLATVVRAYDVRAGSPTWARQLDERSRVVGADPAGVLVTSYVEEEGDDGRSRRTDLVRLDRADGAEHLLGSLPTPDGFLGTMWQDGDFLGLVGQDGVLSAVEVPAEGTPVQVPEDLEDSALTPTEVLDACSAIRPRTLRILGFRRVDPTPYDCTWDDYLSDSRARIEVQVHAGVASSYRTAEEEAADWLDFEGRFFEDTPFAPTFVTPPAATVVPGWADEARVSQAFAPTGTDSFTGVVVRVDNVVVMVQADTEADRDNRGIAGYEMQRAVRDAALEVLAGVGVDAPLPASRTRPGPVTSLPDVCSALAAEAASLTSGVAPQQPGAVIDPESRVGGCRWGDSLSVRAYAVAPSLLDATSGVDLATAALADVCTIGTPTRGIGDQGCRSTYGNGGGESRSTTVTVRSGNLLVEVGYALGGRPTRDQVVSGAETMARSAVAALR